ncbi:MAG: polysaccharide deacetylase family protein [Blautia sp.]|nr:polysaccharide deacetylase family protein [Blautia sp.]
MSTNDAAALEQQRARRKRINRIKTGIILTISIWILVSLLAIILLTVQVVQLNRRLNKLEDTVNRPGESVNVPDTQPAVEESENSESEPLSYENIVTGIDTPDNMAAEGDEHLVYLTFDGSPNVNTDEVLDVLKERGVKATFFVVGDESGEMDDVYKRIVEEGHTLGMHSFSNQYSTIYASTDAFFDDYKRLADYLETVTGVQCKYYRFPGGSSNEISNVNMAEFVHILNENDVVYYDWNVSAGDAAAEYSVEDVISNVTNGVSRYKTSVVLLHDGENKSTTVEALGDLIDALQDMDAEILPIDEDTKVIQYIKADSVE